MVPSSVLDANAPACYSLAMNRPRPLHLAIGEQLRNLRLERGARQDDVAAWARKIGLKWTRATVALLEAGRRQLSLGEFLALPLVLAADPNQPLPPRLTDFVPSDAWLWITPGLGASSERLRDMLQGKNSPGLGPLLYYVPRGGRAPRRQVSGEGNSEIFVSSRASTGIRVRRQLNIDVLDEADRKVARKLRVSPSKVAEWAHKLWGHSLSVERDQLASDKSHDTTSPRALQAIRGHVTRELIERLASFHFETGIDLREALMVKKKRIPRRG
jgi:transcriptional regulator with XRE-family HTH domain